MMYEERLEALEISLIELQVAVAEVYEMLLKTYENI